MPEVAQWVPGPAWSQPSAPVPPAFFGVTLNSSSGAMPGFTVGAVRLWDSRTRWSLLEPARGHFSWTVLDRLVAGARRAGLPVLLSFGGTPGWASPGGPRTPYGDGSRTSPPDRPADRTDFVHAVAARYRGRIQAYEIAETAPLSERDAVDHAVRFYLVGLYLRYRRSYFYDWGGTRLPVVLQAEGAPPTAAGRAVGAAPGVAARDAYRLLRLRTRGRPARACLAVPLPAAAGRLGPPGARGDPLGRPGQRGCVSGRTTPRGVLRGRNPDARRSRDGV